MKTSRFYLVTMASLAGLLFVWLSLPDPGQHQHAYFQHGLKVSIDPDTGEFQRHPVDIREEISPLVESAQSRWQSLFSSQKPAGEEIRTNRVGGGFVVDMEQHFRPSKNKNISRKDS